MRRATKIQTLALGALLPLLLWGCHNFKINLPGAESDTAGAEPSTTPEAQPSSSVDLVGDSQEAALILVGNGRRAWQMSSRVENGDNVPLGCRLDDQLIFEERKVTHDVGSLLCQQPPDAETQVERNTEGTWQMTDQYSILISLKGEPAYTYQIVDISNDKLTLEYWADSFTLVQESYFLVPDAPDASASPSASPNPVPSGEPIILPSADPN